MRLLFEISENNFRGSHLCLIKNNVKLLDVTYPNEIINNYYVSKTNHRVITDASNKTKCRYYWPNIKNSVQELKDNHDVSLQIKYERVQFKIELTHMPMTSRQIETLTIDTQAFNKTKSMTVIDTFSRHLQMYWIMSIDET